jgi:hypothetical protein
MHPRRAAAGGPAATPLALRERPHRGRDRTGAEAHHPPSTSLMAAARPVPRAAGPARWAGDASVKGLGFARSKWCRIRRFASGDRPTSPRGDPCPEASSPRPRSPPWVWGAPPPLPLGAPLLGRAAVEPPPQPRGHLGRARAPRGPGVARAMTLTAHEKGDVHAPPRAPPRRRRPAPASRRHFPGPRRRPARSAPVAHRIAHTAAGIRPGDVVVIVGGKHTFTHRGGRHRGAEGFNPAIQ